MIKDCPQITSHICFHYNHTCHKKVEFPRFTGGSVEAPALVTLRITVGLLGKVEVPVVKIRAF